MPTLSKHEFDNHVIIRIEHHDIKKNLYTLLNESNGNHTTFVGVLINGFKYGFSVNSKKYNVDDITTDRASKNHELVITIPRKKGSKDVISGTDEATENKRNDIKQ